MRLLMPMLVSEGAFAPVNEKEMKRKNQHDKNTVNVQRRRVMQGVGAAAVASVAAPVIGSTATFSNTGDVTGKIVSKLGDPIKSVVVRNNTHKSMTINYFDNGSVMFDGDFVDCNGVCEDNTVTLASGEEKLFQFDKRQMFNSKSRAKSWVNLQSSVSRLSEGTRVLDFSGDIKQGVVTLRPDSTPIFS